MEADVGDLGHTRPLNEHLWPFADRRLQWSDGHSCHCSPYPFRRRLSIKVGRSTSSNISLKTYCERSLDPFQSAFLRCCGSLSHCVTGMPWFVATGFWLSSQGKRSSRCRLTGSSVAANVTRLSETPGYSSSSRLRFVMENVDGSLEFVA